MVLPKSYYGEGSYNNWIREVALKNTHEKLFLTWMKFSSQSKPLILVKYQITMQCGNL